MSGPSEPSQFTLFSDQLKTEYIIHVAEPSRPGPHQLVLVLDGDDQFEPAREAADSLCGDETFPALLLVGIGYGGGYRSSKNKRVRDYTPTQPADEPMESGRARDFLAFLASTLLPELKNRYAFHPEGITVTGHSLGSLFGLYALAQPASPFRRYLVSSPSIWWDNRAVLNLLEEPAQVVRKHSRAFFSVGADDTTSMLGDLALLREHLAAKPTPNLEYAYRTFPARDHYNVLPDAFTEGLRWLYSAPEAK